MHWIVLLALADARLDADNCWTAYANVKLTETYGSIFDVKITFLEEGIITYSFQCKTNDKYDMFASTCSNSEFTPALDHTGQTAIFDECKAAIDKETAPEPAPTPAPTETGDKKTSLSGGAVFGIVFGSLIGAVLIFLLVRKLQQQRTEKRQAAATAAYAENDVLM